MRRIPAYTPLMVCWYEAYTGISWRHLPDSVRKAIFDYVYTMELMCVDISSVRLLLPSCPEGLFHYAVQSGGIGFTRVLLAMGIDVDQGILHPPLLRPNSSAIVRGVLSNGGLTPLMVAIRAGMWAIMSLLLDRNANVNARMESGFTVFMHVGMDKASSEYDYEKCAQMLLTRRANVDSSIDDGSTPLMLASRRGHLAVCRVIIENSATDSVHARATGDMSALTCACMAGHASVVDLLLQANASVNARFGTSNVNALATACMQGHASVVDRLLQASASVNARFGNIHMNALACACVEGHASVVDLLLQANASANDRVGNRNMNVLTCACMEGHASVVGRLLQANASVNARVGNSNVTALACARAEGHAAVVDLLQANASGNDSVGRSSHVT